MSSSRQNRATIGRWLVGYHLHVTLGYSLTTTGIATNRDHATILYGIKQIWKCIEMPGAYRELYEYFNRFQTEMNKSK